MGRIKGEDKDFTFLAVGQRKIYCMTQKLKSVGRIIQEEIPSLISSSE